MPHKTDNGGRKERYLDFVEQCRIEMSLLQETVFELQQILQEIDNRFSINTAVSLRNRAASANLAQSFYNGIENILKRTIKYNSMPLPTGEHWHSELAERFTDAHYTQYGLPLLVPAEIVAPMRVLRRFRHVIMHGYAMNLDWERMQQNLVLIPIVFPVFQAVLEEYLNTESKPFT